MTTPSPESSNPASATLSNQGGPLASSSTAGRVRLWPLWCIIAFVVVTIGATVLLEDYVGFARSFITMSICGLGAIFFWIWFLLLSGLPLSAKFGGFGAGVLSVGIFVALFRFDGWDGQMWPIFARRSRPTAEERFASSRKESRKASTTNQPSTDGPAAEENAQSTESPKNTAPRRLSGEHDFPELLGPKRLGWIPDLKLARDWKARPPKELWRQAVGLGWSAFAIAGDYAVTQEQRGDQETVVAYDLRSGEEFWEYGERIRYFDSAKGDSQLGGDGPRATPTIAGDKVYSLGATGRLNCLDLATGKHLWHRDILEDSKAKNAHWGMSGSPLVHDGKVIVTPGVDQEAGPGDARGVAAYDAESGELAWCAGTDRASYTSPMLANLAGTDQILVYSYSRIAGHDPRSGQVLWKFPFSNSSGILCAQPLVLSQWGYQPEKNLVLVSSGYAVGSMLVEIDRQGDVFSATGKWKSNSNALKSKMANIVVHGEYLYGLDEGILVCVAIADGSRVWKGGRYGHGQLLLVGDLLLIQSEPGELVLVSANPQRFEELSRYPALSDRTWNNLSLSGRLLLTRNDREAVCLELPVEE